MMQKRKGRRSVARATDASGAPRAASLPALPPASLPQKRALTVILTVIGASAAPEPLHNVQTKRKGRPARAALVYAL